MKIFTSIIWHEFHFASLHIIGILTNWPLILTAGPKSAQFRYKVKTSLNIEHFKTVFFFIG